MWRSTTTITPSIDRVSPLSVGLDRTQGNARDRRNPHSSSAP
ncbi:hypothetical protein [Chamaesiphon minutus]|nr:hypothetical protein [Chamaesiphon minutus]